MTDPAPQAPQPAAPAPQPAAPLTEAEDKQWASFAHFGGILWILPSLIIFLVFKDRGAKTRVESKEALNWQITWIAAWLVVTIVGAIIGAIVSAATTPTTLDGLLNYNPIPALVVSVIFGILSWALYIINAVLSIIGGIRVNGGGSYRYPFAIRLIK